MSKTVIIEPDLDQRHLDGYYFQRYYCDNCHNPGPGPINHVDVMIPKGISRPHLLECPNCGLRTLS